MIYFIHINLTQLENLKSYLITNIHGARESGKKINIFLYNINS